MDWNWGKHMKSESFDVIMTDQLTQVAFLKCSSFANITTVR